MIIGTLAVVAIALLIALPVLAAPGEDQPYVNDMDSLHVEVVALNDTTADTPGHGQMDAGTPLVSARSTEYEIGFGSLRVERHGIARKRTGQTLS